MCQWNLMTTFYENFAYAKRYQNGIKEELNDIEHWNSKYGIKCNRKTCKVIQFRANKNYYSLEAGTSYIWNYIRRKKTWVYYVIIGGLWDSNVICIWQQTNVDCAREAFPRENWGKKLRVALLWQDQWHSTIHGQTANQTQGRGSRKVRERQRLCTSEWADTTTS